MPAMLLLGHFAGMELGVPPRSYKRRLSGNKNGRPLASRLMVQACVRPAHFTL
jgi:hypothetical protein